MDGHQGKRKVEDPGIDPGTSRMLSERSTIWANPPTCLYVLYNCVFVLFKMWCTVIDQCHMNVVGLWPIGQCPSPLKPITRSQGGQAGTVNHPSAGSITPSKYENLISFPCLPHPHSHVFHILIPISSTSSFPCLPHPHSHVFHILIPMF